MRKRSTRFWIGLILIIVIYSLYNIYLVDVSYYQSIPRKLRHVGKLSVILMVYGTGTWALKDYFARWMLYLWHLLHLCIIGVLILIGLYDWSFGAISPALRNITGTLFEFLISPLIYLAMGIIGSKLVKPVSRADVAEAKSL